MKVYRIASVPQAVVDLVMRAESQLVLISPYFDPWMQLARAIESAASVRHVETVICVRGGTDGPKQLANTEVFKAAGAQIHSLERLHAKIYVSEKQAIVTSLNLLSSSAHGSYEVAVSFDAETDTEDYRRVVQAAEELIKLAEDDVKLTAARANSGSGGEPPPKSIGFISRMLGTYSSELKTETVSAPATKPGAKSKAKAKSKTKKKKSTKSKRSKPKADSWSEDGHCIRCCDDIAFNPDKPFCLPCYREWADEDDEEYEDFCHGCGDPQDSLFEKPMCRPCYRANK